MTPFPRPVHLVSNSNFNVHDHAARGGEGEGREHTAPFINVSVNIPSVFEHSFLDVTMPGTLRDPGRISISPHHSIPHIIIASMPS